MNLGDGEKSAKMVDNLKSIDIPAEENKLKDVRNLILIKCYLINSG